VLAAPSAPVVDVADWLRRYARDPRHMPEVLTTDGWPGDAVVTVGEHADRPLEITVIDGSKMTRAEENHAARQWVTDAIAGRAPVFRSSATSKR
jgi:hypothetical protein